jgi:hypothetical protein
MENYVLILAGGAISMIVGSIWYGPLFGKKWMEICGVSAMDEAKRKEMQKAAMPLYLTQFLLTLLQLFVLVNQMTWGGWTGQAIGVSLFYWLGFIMPTIAGSAMWNNDSTKVKWARFLIQSGYQLVMFLIFGLMIQMWM